MNWSHQLHEVYHLIISFRLSKHMEISYGLNEYNHGYSRFLVLPENMLHMWLAAGDRPKLDLLVKSFKQNWPRLSRDWMYEWLAGGGVQLAQTLYIGHSNLRCIVSSTVYPKKYAHGFVVLCFVVVMQSFIMNSHEVFIHIHQGCFAGTGAIARLPQCQWSKPDGYGKISQCITKTKHSKAKTVCIFLGIYCTCHLQDYFKMNVKLTTLCSCKQIWLMHLMFSASDWQNGKNKQVCGTIY